MPDGGVEKGLAALFTEADRVAQVRLHADRARSLPADDPASIFEQLASSNDEHTSDSLADEFIRNFMQQRADSRHRLRVRARAPLPAGDHARRRQRPRPRLGARSQPRHRRERAEEGGRGRARRRRRSRRSSRMPAGGSLTAYVDTVSATPLLEPLPKPGTVAKTRDEAGRHHRVDAVERRARRARSDDLQAGRDPVPRLQSRRHVARRGRRLHRRRDGRSDRRRRAASAR